MRSGAHTPTYRSWQMMKNRCLNVRAQDYMYYGGRGIQIDPAWMIYEGFFASMGQRPDGYTLERKDGNGNYEPTNCAWATEKPKPGIEHTHSI